MAPSKTQTEGGVEYNTQKASSKNGREYESGPKVIAKTQAVSALEHGAPFNVSVNWPVDDTWHNTSDAFAAQTGITSYIIGNSSSPFYDYYIEFSTNQDYDYFFTDQSPDTYENNVSSTTSSHITRYNSTAPTIVYVTGK